MMMTTALTKEEEDRRQELVQGLLSDRRCFPDTEAVLLHWTGGTSGAFAASVISYFIWPDRPHIQLSPCNNSHAGLDSDLFNWDRTSYSHVPGGYHPWLPPRHRFLQPLDPAQPILIPDHSEADWSALWQRWPRARAVVIAFRPSDTVETNFNMYWKFYVENHRPYNPGNAWWLQMQEKFPDILAKYSHPADISVEDQRRLLEPAARHIQDHVDPHFFGIQGTAPLEYQDRVWQLPYWRLTRDPDWVLHRMSQFLERPIPDAARVFYQQYLARQNQLIQKHAPWLREPGRPWNRPMQD